MHRNHLAPLLLGLLSSLGCQPQAPAEGPAPALPGDESSGGPQPRPGAVTLARSGALRIQPDESSGRAAVEVSAPILPRTDVLYPLEDAGYPLTAAAEAAAAHSAALTYDLLLPACAAAYPTIHLPAGPGDDELTPAEREANYNAVAACAYHQYTAKPYWIPLLVDHVDLCAQELGPDWHLPTQAELLALSDGDLRRLGERLGALRNSGVGLYASYYFSLQLYARDMDHVLALGDLSPGAAERVSRFPVSGEALKRHFENAPNPISLRCLRAAP